MRSVTYLHTQQPVQVNGAWIPQPMQSIPAKFHQWAIDADGPVAILEHDNGSIKVVAAELVTFINPQSSV